MATASQTFQQVWRVGRRVQERSAPHRTGTIRARRGTGINATIFVTLPGQPPASFRPSQLTPL